MIRGNTVYVKTVGELAGARAVISGYPILKTFWIMTLGIMIGMITELSFWMTVIM